MKNRARAAVAATLLVLLAACGPAAQSEGERGGVYLDSMEIIQRESYPVQVALVLQGSLPTPCHELRTEVAEPDEQGRIVVDVYSLVDPDEVCIQVLQPFEETVELGSYTQGTFTVWVNGEQVGEVDL
ncbi:MAG TPA: hypothetical protein VGC81_15250 [Candidatus Methylomirabilis sp.]